MNKINHFLQGDVWSTTPFLNQKLLSSINNFDVTETHFESPQKDDCCPVQKGQTQNGLKASKIIRKVLSVYFFLFMAS